MYVTDASRWQAVQTRDQAASSSFVYAVISTKIYCRPACPSRIARRANVCFYDTAEDAAKAGYRPCLRCKPDQSTYDLDKERTSKDAVRRACEYIAETQGQVKFPEVAKHVGLSTRYLYGLFKMVTGTTPAKYADQFKPSLKTRPPFETVSPMSDTLSPYTAGADSTATPTTAWSNISGMDNFEPEMFQAAYDMSVQHSDTPDDPWQLAGATDKGTGANNFLALLSHEFYDLFPMNPEWVDPTHDFYIS